MIRKSNKSNAANAGKMLFQQAHPDLLMLNSFIGIPGIKLSTISDKLSGELLQCGIDFFSYQRDSDTDPSRDVMDLFRKAKSLAIGNIAKERCKENMIGLQEWIDDKPNREKRNEIKDELNSITNCLIRFKTLSATNENAKNLIINCKPKLRKIKSTLGSKDDFYLHVSSAVVQNVLNMLVTIINGESEKLKTKSAFLSRLSTPLPIIILEALDITFMLGSLNMYSNMRQHYNKNLSDLKAIAYQIGVSTTNPKDKFKDEIRQCENSLKEVQDKIFLKGEIDNIQSELKKNEMSNYFKKDIDVVLYEIKKINRWKYLKSRSKIAYQINIQQQKINDLLSLNEKEKMRRGNKLNSNLAELLKRSEVEKAHQIKAQEQKIENLKALLNKYE